MILVESVWLPVLAVLIAVMTRDSARICVVFESRLPSPATRLELGNAIAGVEEEVVVVEDEHRIAAGHVPRVLAERLRIQDLMLLGWILDLIGRTAEVVSLRFWHLKGEVTCEAPGRDIKRSCWRVRSTLECFWNCWRAFEGPQRASAMASV